MVSRPFPSFFPSSFSSIVFHLSAEFSRNQGSIARPGDDVDRLHLDAGLALRWDTSEVSIFVLLGWDTSVFVHCDNIVLISVTKWIPTFSHVLGRTLESNTRENSMWDFVNQTWWNWFRLMTRNLVEMAAILSQLEHANSSNWYIRFSWSLTADEKVKKASGLPAGPDFYGYTFWKCGYTSTYRKRRFLPLLLLSVVSIPTIRLFFVILLLPSSRWHMYICIYILMLDLIRFNQFLILRSNLRETPTWNLTRLVFYPDYVPYDIFITN